MKRIFVFISLLFIISFASCSTVENDTQSKLPTNNELSTNSEMRLSEYNGLWYSEDYQKQKDNYDDSVPVGTEMIVNISDTSNNGTVKLICTSLPPASRIAEVDASITINNDKQASFNFDDDGWGNKGTATITFEKQKIIVEIEFNYSAGDNWSMFEGTKIFTREINENSGDEPKPSSVWLFSPEDLHFSEGPIWNISYEQLINDFGKPIKIETYKVRPPATEEGFYQHFTVLKYDGFECEFDVGNEERYPEPSERVLRFDITSAHAELDCGLKIGMTVEEIIDRFGERIVYNLEKSEEDFRLIDLKHVLKSYKPEGYYSEYKEAMIIYFDYDKFEDPLAKVLVLLIKEDTLDRIVFGYPTAG